MEDKNIALLGFVTSAAEYLKKGLDNNIQEEDLNDAMKELEKNVSSSFSGSSALSYGVDYGGYPVFRTISLGIGMNF